MLENLEQSRKGLRESHATWYAYCMRSENALSADNQQERLIKTGWILGYVDGEGCFSIGFIRQCDRQEETRLRRGYRTGYQVFHEFAVTQGEKSVDSLRILKEFFGIGEIYPNRRHDNHKENLYRYVVRRRDDLIHVIIPFFREFGLKTAKRHDFEKFAECIFMMHEGKHMTSGGLVEIAKIASTMNRKKPRENLIRILRDHTPTSS